MEEKDRAGMLPSGLLGTWHLRSYSSVGAEGIIEQNFGANPKGIATFDAAGFFSIIVLRSDLPPFAVDRRVGGTDVENQAVVHGSLAYFGTWSRSDAADELLFRIDGATLPNWAGTTQVRKVSMPDARSLVLMNPAASGGGRAWINWTRVDQAGGNTG